MSIISKEKKDLLIREDKNDQYTIFIKDTQRQLFLNKTGWDIFNNCYLFDTFEELFSEFKSQYPGIDEKRLKTDLLATLTVFEIYGLTNQMSCSKSVWSDGITFAGDLHYQGLGKFIEQYKSTGFFRPNKDVDFSEITLRIRTMNNTEYYILNIINGKINFVLSVTPPNHYLSPNVFLINSMFSSLIDDKELVNLINSSINFLVQSIDIPINKLRLNVTNRLDKKTDRFIKLLLASGFIQECELKKEIGDEDLVMFTKFI